MIDFYHNPMSRARIAHWALEESGADYRSHILEFGAMARASDYLAINPMGKVPAIVHHVGGRDVVVTEAAAICAYLADTFPAAGIAPTTEAERASYYRWLFFAAGPLEAAVTNKAMGWEKDDAKTRSTVGYGSLEAVLDALEAKVANDPFICGDRFTMADVYVGSHIDFGLKFGTIEPRSAFKEYAGRATDRNAYRRAEVTDDALIAAIQTK